MRIRLHWHILLLGISALVVTLPVFWMTRGQFFRLFSDHDALLPVYSAVSTSIRATGSIPRQADVAAAGIPVWGDPLSGVPNPLLYLPLAVWGVPVGMRVVIVELLFLSAVGMWFWLRRLQVNGTFRLWGSLLYMLSGGIAARVHAGHWEQLFVFPVMPWLLSLTLQRFLRIRTLAGIAFLLAFLGYSGALYHVWYGVILFMCVRGYFCCTRQSSLRRELAGAVMLLFMAGVLFGPKIHYFLRDIGPVYERTIADPSRGSLHLPLVWLPFAVPVQTGFYDRPFFQHWLGFYYNWYEYYAFIAPTALLFLWHVRRIWRNPMVRLLLVILATGALYVARRYPYSPFYWLDQVLPAGAVFRAPQRMYLPLTAALVALLALSVQHWYLTAARTRTRRFLMLCLAVTILWNTTVSMSTLESVFEPVPPEAQRIAGIIRGYPAADQGVISLVCCMQWLLTQQGIPLVNYYYGWFRRDIPRYISPDGSPDVEALRHYPGRYAVLRTADVPLLTPTYSLRHVEGNWAIVERVPGAEIR